jgi:hypothetical protein
MPSTWMKRSALVIKGQTGPAWLVRQGPPHSPGLRFGWCPPAIRALHHGYQEPGIHQEYVYNGTCAHEVLGGDFHVPSFGTQNNPLL